MTLKVFGYVAPAHKDSDAAHSVIRSTIIEPSSDLFLHIIGLFESAKKDCDIDVSFIPESGLQKNAVRSMIIDILKKQTLESGIPLVARLCAYTDKKTKDGLLFIVIAKKGRRKQICVARLPSETGIMVKNANLELEFEIKDDVFLKNSRRYKAILLEGEGLSSDFWDGKAIDKQINGTNIKDISDYWIKEFLLCDMKMTPQRGSRIFAVAMQKAVQVAASEGEKQEIISASSLLAGRNGKAISIRSAIEESGMSREASEAILSQFDGAEREIAEVKFRFDIEEYMKHFNYRFVFLNNGAIIVASSSRFDDIWHKESVAEDEVNYSTHGKVEKTKIGNRL